MGWMNTKLRNAVTAATAITKGTDPCEHDLRANVKRLTMF